MSRYQRWVPPTPEPPLEQRRDLVWCLLHQDLMAKWFSEHVLTALCDLRAYYPGLSWSAVQAIFDDASLRVADTLDEWCAEEEGHDPEDDSVGGAVIDE